MCVMHRDSTCWILIDGATRGDAKARDEFVRRYAPALRAYLLARWGDSPHAADVDDATQEVLLDCFRTDGALERFDPARGGSFRAFLYGIARNVALRFERGRARKREVSGSRVGDLAADETSLSRVFDRAYATGIVREAVRVHRDRARRTARGARGGIGAERRFELLRLRFSENQPIREIATQWGIDAAVLHKEYARAREEFREVLLEVVASQRRGSPAEVERECEALLDLLL